MKSPIQEEPSISPIFGLLKSKAFHITLLCLISIVISILYGISQQPIFSDRAYFIYMGQVVFRGNELYKTTVFGYTPYGPFLSAATMFVGSLFHIPTFLSPRYFSILILAINSSLIYLAVRNAWNNSLMALTSGLILNGFGLMSILSTAGLEPKVMVVCLTLLSVLLLQKNKWLGVGVTAGIAVMFWQPAVILAIIFFFIMLFQKNFWSKFLKFSLGMLFSLLPALLYLTIKSEWHTFIIQAVLIKTITDMPNVGSNPFYWFVVSSKFYVTEIAFLISSLIGFPWFMIKKINQKKLKKFKFLIDIKYGGLVLLTIGWAAFNSLEFDQGPDLIPTLPFIAIWASWFIFTFFKIAYQKLKKILSIELRPISQKRMLTIAGFICLCALLYFDSFMYSIDYTIRDQKKLIESMIKKDAKAVSFIAFNVEEVYVLTNLQASIPYIHLERWVDYLIEKKEPHGSQGFISELEKQLPRIFIIVDSSSLNLRKIKEKFLSNYSETTILTVRSYASFYKFLSPEKFPKEKIKIYTRKSY